MNARIRGRREMPAAYIYTLTFAIIILIFSQTGHAQTSDAVRAEPHSEQVTPVSDPKEEKLKQLEAQVESMQRQIDVMRSMIDELKDAKPATNVAARGEGAAPAVMPAAPGNGNAPASSQPASQAKPELGVNLGPARLTPYGSIYFNAFGNSGGTNNADVPLFATPTGRGGTGASLRQTRLGARLEGAKVGNARLGAVIEADFFGGFPSVGIGENFGVVRLRLANIRLDWEKTSVTFGQDWSVFAPVSPTSLAAAAIPQLAAAGNNWARLPQIRVDSRPVKNVLLQAAVAAQQTGDSAANAPFFLQPNSGSAARVPFVQARAAYSNVNPFGAKKAGSVGISGHYGRSRVFTAANVRSEVDSVGVALDWNLSLHDRLTWAGEAFFGRNLAGFQAGIYQGNNTEFAYRQGAVIVPGGVRGIGTRGGWTQVGFTPDAFGDRLSLYASLGIDDPRNADLVTIVPRDLRSRNFAVAFDAIYKFTPQFSIGTEFRRFHTDWTISGRQRSNHVNLAAVYNF